MKCGELGHKTVRGVPCDQNISSRAKGCLWHGSTSEQRAVLAMKGGIASKMRRAMPADYQMPPWDSREAVVQFAENMARTALTADVDPRRIDVALRAANVALAGFQQATQGKLVDALVRVERGGAAVVLLERLTAGLTTGRLPGRAPTRPEGEGA